MTAEFLGSKILVTLQSPPRTQLQGTVADIIGQQLTLHHGEFYFPPFLFRVFDHDTFPVTWLATDQKTPSFIVQGSNIADLEVLPNTPDLTSSTTFNEPSEPIINGQEEGINGNGLQTQSSYAPSSHAQASELIASPHSTVQQQSFIDPAIISLQRLPANSETTHVAISPGADIPVIPPSLPEGASSRGPSLATSQILLKPPVPISTKPKPTGEGSIKAGRIDPLPSATLSGPFDDLTLTTYPVDTEPATAELGLYGGKEEPRQNAQASFRQVEPMVRPDGKRRRPSRAKVPKAGTLERTTLALSQDQHLSPMGTKTHKQTTAAKSRRKSSIVEKSPASPSKHGQGTTDRRDNVSAKRQSRREFLLSSEAQNGWATEEATDIQEMGEFDFEGNLSKFDKREVFNQFKYEDTTADEARLVSHNRLPAKPGTAGGKNLHFTENVLGSPKATGHIGWTSEAGESELDAKVSSGMSTRRSGSRATLRKPPSRKGSGIGAGNEVVKTSTTPIGSARYSSFDRGSPRDFGRNRSVSPYAASINSNSNSILRIVPHGKLCPCLGPLQMLELEQFAVSDLGMTEEMMTENAGRSISQTAVRSLDVVKRRLQNDDQLKNPLVTVAVGNHKTGARAIAAARHLQNHGFRINVCILGGEREDELLDSVKHQVSAYRKSGGTLLSPPAMLDGLKGGQIRPHLIIDALLGVHGCFEDLRRDDQATYFEFVIWVNRNELDVLSIDVPSGIDASNGKILLSYAYVACRVLWVSEFFIFE